MKNEEASGHDTAADKNAWKKIAAALESERYPLPVDFADRVVKRIEAKHRIFSNDSLWFGLGIVFIIISSIGTFAYLNVKIDLQLPSVKILPGYGGLIVFTIAFILVLQVIDRTVIKRRVSH